MLKIAICEDNSIYAKELSKKVSYFFWNRKIDFSISIFSLHDEIEALDFSQYSLFLLDIELGNKNGIEIGIQIKKCNPSAAIIYVSEFYTYAIAGYKARPMAYILKSDTQFDKNLDEALQDFVHEKLNPQEFIDLKTKHETACILLNDIIYVESFSRKIMIHIADGTDLEIYGKISEMENHLANKGFLRIHKSYLVNMNCISKISNYQTFINSGKILPTSKNKYSSIIKTFAIWKGQK